MVEIQSRQTKKLTKAEELNLGKLIQEGLAAKKEMNSNQNISSQIKRSLKMKVSKGENAENELVAANINLVVSLAMKYRENYPYAPDLEECSQEGLVGLIIAARKYDPSKGNKFSTMAVMWIRQSISRGVNSGSKLVRLPENRVEEYSKISTIERKILSENENATRDEIDNAIFEKFPRLNKEYLYSIRNAASEYYSLNRKVNYDDESSAELMDIISETSTDSSAENSILDAELQSNLDSCLSSLEEKQRNVVMSSFGMSVGGIHAVLTEKEVREKYTMKSSEYKKTLEKGLVALRCELHNKGLSMADFL